MSGSGMGILATTSSSSPAVLFTIADLRSTGGGSRKAAADLCLALGACGVRVSIISQAEAVPSTPSLTPDSKYVKSRLVKLSMAGIRRGVMYAPRFKRELTYLCRQESIQIIHDHGLWLPSNHAAARVAHRLRIPLVIHPHGMLQPEALYYRAWKKRIAWLLYQRRDLKIASLFVATADREAEAIRRAGLIQPIALIPNGVPIPALTTHSPVAKEIRQALFLSRIHPIKGLLNLVAAWQHVRPEGWRMIIAGQDERGHLQEVKRAVQASGLQEHFKFIGTVEGEAKERLFREADLFILPSSSENFGLVVAEALSYGVPVITTKGTPWQGLVKNRCGWWVELGVRPLSEAIQAAILLTDAERYAMGRRGRCFVAEAFSFNVIALEMLAVYEWIRGIGAKPSCILQ
jgi:glycosyltransferase involved in cell wall biosynthesis